MSAAARAGLLLALLALAPTAAAAAEEPFPPGTSSREMEGLRCSLVIPEGDDPAAERSLLVIRHGGGGT